MKKLACVLASAALLVTGVVVSGSEALAVEPAEVLPTPQEASDDGAAVALDGAVTVVADAAVDAPSKDALTAVLDAAGATTTWATSDPGSCTVVHLGVSDADTQAVADASGLPADGYVVGQWQDYAQARMTDGDLSSYWWSNAAPTPGSWVQLDLGSAQEVGSVAIHQADNDTTAGDMFYDATLQYSLDGQDWTDAGTFTNAVVIKHVFPEPVQARYVRLVSNESNNKWVKIREFQATGPVEAFGTNIDVADGSAPSLAFDIDVQTALTGTAADGNVLERQLTEPQTGGSLVVIGQAAGGVEVLTEAGWTAVGELDPAASWNRFGIGEDVTFTGVRVSFAAGEVSVTEFIVSTETIAPPTEPTEEPSEEPSGEPTEEPTTAPTTTPTQAPTTAPTASPSAPGVVDVYSEPGVHNVGGRLWYTECEPYSQTIRCTTEIWATSVELVDGRFVGSTGWKFNNLTYLPGMTRQQWSQNPLGHTGSWVSGEGRRWRTECDTAVTGQGGCRSYIFATLVQSSQATDGTWSHRTVVDTGNGFEQRTAWVFNNLTYLPEMTRAAWGDNPLANTGEWTIDGRQWRTECDTTTTGRGGCRSYIVASVVTSDGDGYRWVTKEVFNNLVLFKR